MAKLTWHGPGDRVYETGVSKGALYLPDENGKYDLGVPWNGLTAVTESPSGAEPNAQYADNIKYLNLVSAEEFGCTIEAFTYPDEFMLCDGTAEVVPGVYIGQQNRKTFGFSYQTLVGDELQGTDRGYKIHLVWHALAAPTEKGYNTVNDTPEAITFSWEVSTTAVEVPGFKPSATMVIDSTVASAAQMAAIEEVLYGTETLEARLPFPAEIIEILEEALEPPVGG